MPQFFQRCAVLTPHRRWLAISFHPLRTIDTLLLLTHVRPNGPMFSIHLGIPHVQELVISCGSDRSMLFADRTVQRKTDIWRYIRQIRQGDFKAQTSVELFKVFQDIGNDGIVLSLAARRYLGTVSGPEFSARDTSRVDTITPFPLP